MKHFICILAIAALLLPASASAFVTQSENEAKSFNNYAGTSGSRNSSSRSSSSSSSRVRRIRLDKKSALKESDKKADSQEYSINLDKDNKFSLVTNEGDYITFTGKEPENARWEIETDDNVATVNEQHADGKMLLKLQAQSKGVSRVSLQLVFRQNRVVKVIKSKRLMVTIRP